MKRGTVYSHTKRGRQEKAKIYSFSQYYRFQLIIKRGLMISKTVKRKGNVSRKKTHEYSGLLFTDLPRDILINILLRLPVKSILASKYVCKTWYELISDYEFAKLHYDQAEAYPVIHRSGSGIIYLIQPGKTDFDHKLGMSCDHCSFKPGCVCNVEVKLDAIFEISDTYDITNSCNGLLFLESDNDPLIVCNPITGEFINLPSPKKKAKCFFWYNFGFGFSPVSNQYKVIRMSQRYKGVGITAEVHIIGTKTWKQIGYCIKSIPKYSFPVYLNGFLYWSSSTQEQLSLISFDITSECFELVLGPTTDERCLFESDSVVVLGGELCISAVVKSRVIHVWSMKDYGTEEKTWSKVFSFDLNCFQLRNYGSFEPIKYMNDGALLMFSYHTHAFIYMDPKKNRIRSLNVRGCGGDQNEVDPIVEFIPSFVSLKLVFSGQNVKVHNIKSRSDMHLVEDEFYG